MEKQSLHPDLPESIYLDRVMQPEHIDQIVGAILDTKYSWACVLILRYSGCNPLQYIPDRTYRRLCREHKITAKMASHESITAIH
jgi:hypothetical protein